MFVLELRRNADDGRLFSNRNSAAVDAALVTVAAERGVSLEKIQADYAAMVERALDIDRRTGKTGRLERPFVEGRSDEFRVPELSSVRNGLVQGINGPLQDNGRHMASMSQLRFGSLVGDSLGGLDPVFGALLSPTGGIPGAGNVEISDRLYLAGGGRDVVGIHGVAHDAAGYLRAYYNQGPGYNYVPAGIRLLADTNPLAGQISGIDFFKNLLRYGNPFYSPPLPASAWPELIQRSGKMNRRSFGLAVSASSVGFTMRTSSVLAAIAYDDESSEMMPVTVVTHTLGQAFVVIRMSLQSPGQREELALSPNGSISVNGSPLTLERTRGRVNYVAKVPITGRSLKFELRRSRSKVDVYSLELPLFKVLKYPAEYRTPENVSFILARPLIEPLKTVTVDSHSFLIETDHMTVGFSSLKVPSDDDPELIVKTIGNIEQPPGRCAASVYRQQRTPMRVVSENYKTGWVVATVSDDFKINVLG
jgi:hypothetical protein